jgi:MFS family permease
VVGSEVTRVALPLTAVLLLDATPAQMALLQAVEAIPHLVLGFVAGVWVDRLRRRPVMILADLGRAAALCTVPAAAVLGVLRMEQLYVVIAVMASLTLFFDVAAFSFLPSFVPRALLTDANGKLAASASAAQVAGPGLAGLLVQALTAPIAIAVDAVSFVLSALFLGLMRVPEDEPAAGASARGERPNAWREAREGLRVLLADPVLRAGAGSGGAFNFFTQVFWAAYLIYATRDLGASPAVIGVAFAAGGVGGLLGALLAARTASRFGLGSTLVGASLAYGIGFWPVAAATPSWPALVVAATLAAAHFLRAVSLATLSVNFTAVQQALVPDRLRGRVAAAMHVIVFSTLPVGSLVGGLLGEWLGLQATLVVGALGGLVGFLWTVLSPMRAMRELPAPTLQTRSRPT